MFLHEIFHQGLKARLANWPTLVLGKLLQLYFASFTPKAILNLNGALNKIHFPPQAKSLCL